MNAAIAGHVEGCIAMKLYQSGEIYNAVKPDTFFETAFGELILKHKDALFPEFFALSYPDALPSRTTIDRRHVFERAHIERAGAGSKISS